MSSPIFDAMGRNIPNNNVLNMIQQFNNFKRNFNGDPKMQVQQLLQSGKMSQQQFNQLAQMANQFQSLMK